MSAPDTPHPPGPLTGLRVVDMTALVPGQLTTLLLADYGADVIKVEGPTRPDGGRIDQPRGPNGTSYRFNMLNRNKRAFAVNLKADAGREALLRLLDTADVLIEGFRPGVMDRLGVGYEVVSARNPQIVYCSLSGYGQDGPYALDPGHDLNYMSAAGITVLFTTPTGNPDQPLRSPWIPVADIGGGSLMAVFGILAALNARATTGRGDHVDVSMTDGIFFWQNARIHTFLSQGRDPEPSQLSNVEALPGYSIYAAGDGKLLSLGCIEPQFWASLRVALDLADELPEVQPRDDAAADAARATIAKRLRDHDRSTWIETLRSHDVPTAPVLSMSELPDDPNVRARELLIDRDLGDGIPTHVGFPVKLKNTQPTLRTPAPALGANTRELLEELGYAAADIDQLATDGTIV